MSRRRPCRQAQGPSRNPSRKWQPVRALGHLGVLGDRTWRSGLSGHLGPGATLQEGKRAETVSPACRPSPPVKLATSCPEQAQQEVAAKRRTVEAELPADAWSWGKVSEFRDHGADAAVSGGPLRAAGSEEGVNPRKGRPQKAPLRLMGLRSSLRISESPAAPANALKGLTTSHRDATVCTQRSTRTKNSRDVPIAETRGKRSNKQPTVGPKTGILL